VFWGGGARPAGPGRRQLLGPLPALPGHSPDSAARWRGPAAGPGAGHRRSHVAAMLAHAPRSRRAHRAAPARSLPATSVAMPGHLRPASHERGPASFAPFGRLPAGWGCGRGENAVCRGVRGIFKWFRRCRNGPGCSAGLRWAARLSSFSCSGGSSAAAAAAKRRFRHLPADIPPPPSAQIHFSPLSLPYFTSKPHYPALRTPACSPPPLPPPNGSPPSHHRSF
jgi:hypothetical protein